jgi:RNA polymerase-binding transcription factor DksA
MTQKKATQRTDKKSVTAPKALKTKESNSTAETKIAKKSTSTSVKSTSVKKDVKIAKTEKQPTEKPVLKNPVEKSKPSQTTHPKESIETALITEKIKAATTRPKHTPPIFKLSTKKQGPSAFTLDDVQKILQTRNEVVKAPVMGITPSLKKKGQPTPPIPEVVEEIIVEKRKLGAASLMDILGIPAKTDVETTNAATSQPVPRKWERYYQLLIDMRDHLKEVLDLHTRETLKRSVAEDSGDISKLSSHMADNGTDTFERDFALNLVSNEQEALLEIELAINRIFKGTYGVCEITGKPINSERLEAVPFTRFSLEGQAQHEKQNRRLRQKGGVYLEAELDESASFSEDDSDE